ETRAVYKNHDGNLRRIKSLFFFSSRRRHTRSVSAFLLNRSSDLNQSLSKTDALDEEKWLNMLGTFVKDWFRYESHFVHGRDSLRSEERRVGKECISDW